MSSLPLTQKLPEEPDSADFKVKENIGFLVSNGVQYQITIGETKIGRDASVCSILFNNNTLSKVHAVIESDGAEDTFIYDAGSTNHTKLGKSTLKPYCRYKLVDNDVITFGNVTAIFKTSSNKIKPQYSLTDFSLQTELDTTSTCMNMEKSSPKNAISFEMEGDIFKTPSFLKKPICEKKKFYNISPPSVDIFSLETQCQIIDEEKEETVRKGPNIGEDADDIFNMPTQCGYSGDIKSQHAINLKTNAFNEKALSYQNSPVVNFVDHDDSGTFNFVKSDKFNKCTVFEGQNTQEIDIFSCDTQIQYKNESKNEGTLVGTSDDVEPSFKNKILNNFDKMFQLKSDTNEKKCEGKDAKGNEGMLNKENNGIYVQKPAIKLEKNDCDPNITIFLSDDDDELCELMLINSPTTFVDNEMVHVENSAANSEKSRNLHEVSQDAKVNAVRKLCTGTKISGYDDLNMVNENCRKISNEKQLLENDENQIQRHLKNTSNIAPVKDLVCEKNSVGKRFGNVEKKESTDNLKGNENKIPDIGEREIKKHNERKHFAKQSHKDGDFKNKSQSSEFRIEGSCYLTCDFGKSLANGCGKICDEETIIYGEKVFSSENNSEDDIPTQVFQFSEKLKKTVENCLVRDHEMYKSLMMRDGKLSSHIEAKKNNCRCKITELIEQIGSVLQSSDSGDETESDLESKLCKESSNRATETKQEKRSPINTGPVQRNVCPERANTETKEYSNRERSTSESSDKTVSDLDIRDADGNSASVLNGDNSDNEDFIATQMFPTNRETPNFISNSKEPKDFNYSNSNAQKIVSQAALVTTEMNNENCEDLILTQVFPQSIFNRADVGREAEVVDTTTTKYSGSGTVVLKRNSTTETVVLNKNESGIGNICNKKGSQSKMSSCRMEDNYKTRELSPTLMQPQPVSNVLFDKGSESKCNRASSINVLSYSSKPVVTESPRQNNIQKVMNRALCDYSEQDENKQLQSISREDKLTNPVKSETELGILSSSDEHLDKLSLELNSTPEFKTYLVEAVPSTSSFNQLRQIPRNVEQKESGDKLDDTSEKNNSPRKITSHIGLFPIDFTSQNKESPPKRSRLSNMDDKIPKKKAKSQRKKARTESTIWLRSRGTIKDKPSDQNLSKNRPSSTPTERNIHHDKSLGCIENTESLKRQKQSRLIAEVDLGNIISANESTTRLNKPAETNQVKTTSSTEKILTHGTSEVEEKFKRNLRPRRSNLVKPLLNSSDHQPQMQSNKASTRRGSNLLTKVVFTGFESESHNKIITKLGGVRINDLDNATVLVSDKVRRTVKFLSAVALGLPIVSPKWLTSSEKASGFLDPWDYLLIDKEAEERWSFSLKVTLKKSMKHKLLRGYSVNATENTKPPLAQMLDIVTCCGGIPLSTKPDIWPEKSILLTCIEDIKSWPPPSQKQVKIVHYEFLLSGVLRHILDFQTYKLR